jgi:VanZ family protein
LSQTNIIILRITLAVALITILHLATTQLQYPIAEDMNDKVSHFLAFYGLAFLVDFSFPRSRFGISKVLFLISYGLIIECIQYFIPYRMFSLYDLAADCIGLVGYTISLPALKKVPVFAGRWHLR